MDLFFVMVEAVSTLANIHKTLLYFEKYLGVRFVFGYCLCCNKASEIWSVFYEHLMA